MSHRQMPYANVLEAKKLHSQACNIYGLWAIFRPFLFIYVPQTTQNLVISRCFAEDGKEMYKEL